MAIPIPRFKISWPALGVVAAFFGVFLKLNDMENNIIKQMTKNAVMTEEHEKSDIETHSKMWKRLEDMDNRIYGLQGKNNRTQTQSL